MPIARVLIIAGVVLLLIGIGLSLGAGRLPGDFTWRRGNFTFYFPLMTSILVSIVLTLIFWLLRR